MSYRYIKAPPGHILVKRNPAREKLHLIISSTLLTLGIMAFTSVAYPMLTYQSVYAPKFNNSPRVLGATNITGIVVPSSPPSTLQVVPEIVNTSLDYTNADNWFGSTKSTQSFDSVVYQLSIPKLGIHDAIARNDHTDLKQSLIHYPGTAMPGDLGNPVIFGHSVLPQFFNPKNYLTIFSTLHTLELGDNIIVKSGLATYTYEIVDMYQTTPEDLAPLAQNYGNRYLTLITCTPPGTYIKRLIIKATLI